jgi:pimeloyl-ACP methyl ester carboxylesterase
MPVNINGTRIAYSDNGGGMSLVFLHAFPLNRTMWGPQEKQLSRRFRIVTVDLRGHGESDAPLWHYSLEQYADDVNGLLDHLAIERAVLIGLSMGGYVNFAFYRKYARRVRALVLADTRAAADSAEARTGRFNLAQTAYRKGAEAVAETMLPKLLGATSIAKRPGIVRQVRHMIETCEVSGIVVDSVAMAERPDSMSLLALITCPTLVLVGEEDATTPPSEAGLMAQAIPGARLSIIPGAGHLSSLEQPDLFNREVEQFVEKLS